MPTEAWMRGPVPGVDPWLQPAAHAFLQAGEDVDRVMADFPLDRLWVRPAGAASVAFHLRHVAGATDRLLSYARGESLSAEQVAAAKVEGTEDPATTAELLVAGVHAAFDRALGQIRSTSPQNLLDGREVGRARLPSTVLGLVFHAAEHATRHVGQLITTAKIVRAGPVAEP